MSLLSGLLLSMVLLGSGCQHHVSFQDLSYQIHTQKYDQTLVLVMDPDTLHQTVTIRSFMAGAANSWLAQPGLMLKEVAEVEFPQMFKRYVLLSSAELNNAPQPRLFVHMSIVNYAFADMRATVTVRATVNQEQHEAPLLEESYSEQGVTQGGKMFWGGAFAMKSAIRQSSLDAYKKIFARFRQALDPLL